MIITSDADWAEISAAAGLPDAARDEITAQNLSFWEDPDREFEVRSYRTKVAVRDALRLTKELSDVLPNLKQNENYRCYNTGGNPLSVAALDEMWNSVDRLLERLSLDSERFGKKNMRGRDDTRLINHVRRLLETRDKYLNTGFPLQTKETPMSGRFREYLKLCTGSSDGGLDAVLKPLTVQFGRKPKTARRRTSVACQGKFSEL